MSYFERKENQKPRYLKYSAVSDNINILTIVAQFLVLIMVLLLFVLPVFTASTPSGDVAFSFFDESKYLVNIALDFIRGTLDHDNFNAAETITDKYEVSEAYKVAVAYSSGALLALLLFIITAILLVIAHIRSIARLCKSETDTMMKYHRIKNLGYLKERSFSNRRTIADFLVLAFLIAADFTFFKYAPGAEHLIEFRKAASFSGVNITAAFFLVLIVIYAIVIVCIKRQEKILVALVHREETI